ncbi:hypothetical protein AN478_10395 [Thiohalorhabdus denitrificans]|uniref:Tetratricopeptide repeat-containing protein n=1 Tax=Thiohalorhabdus denitrificans TaxID=381306 RepID=A0A0N8PMS6_9GAMM|nr:porin family protein [Thiohalorhabdus denitrificans]KPV39549.1 hypothetical protein AN478_10395 [Thiohalorhabdus denitrificans]SCX98991.1 Protein of unknown function [Thiohalorhabdus denitrificans]
MPKRINLTLLVLLFTTPAWGAPNIIEKLSVWVESGQPERAYELGLEYRHQYEGTPRFDFYYGVAAVDTGHYTEGTMALERVLLRQPDLDRARLELARAYYLMGEDRRAEEEFETLDDKDTPPEVAEAVDGYLAAIRSRDHKRHTDFTGHIELAGGHDSNVNSATADDSVTIMDGLLALQLDDESKAIDDNFGQVRAGLGLTVPTTPYRGFFLQVDGSRTMHAEATPYDTALGAAQLGAQWWVGPVDIRLGASGRRFYLDSEPYQDAYGVFFDGKVRVGETWQVSWTARGDRLAYPEQEVRNSILWNAGLGLSKVWNLPWQVRTALNGFYGSEIPDEDTEAASAIAERDMVGGRFGLSVAPSGPFLFTATGTVRRSEYAGEQALFGEAREETLYQAEAGLDWTPAAGLRVGPRASYAVNDANLDLYAYERTRYWLRVRYDLD